MKRAIGIVRVSETGGRNGESFHSPDIQRDRIEHVCEAQGLRLVATHKEMDVSGGKPLAARPGLGAAVAAVEAGEAEVIVAAYFDRLFRSLTTQAEVIDRVERAGGKVLAVDVGQVTNGSAAQWLSGTMLGAVADYYRRSTAERIAGTHVRCIARGVAPFPLPPGYRRQADGVAELDPVAAPVVREAWERRAGGASVPEVRAFLVAHGVRVEASTVSRMFRKRFYLGELRYREDFIEPNLSAHEPLVEPELWERVQRLRGATGGRRSKSPRLLARLKGPDRRPIVVCAACERGLSVSTKEGHRSPFYRCTNHDCEHRPTIVASLLEPLVVARVLERAGDITGTASRESGVIAAREALRGADTALERLIDRLAMAGVADEAVAVERVREARGVRERAQAAYDAALAADDAYRIAITAGDVFEHGSMEAQRELVVALVERVLVGRGKGTDRVKVRDRR